VGRVKAGARMAKNAQSIFMKPTDITIDEEFRDLIPPLSKDEKTRLEDSLASCGMLSPLIVWKHEGQIILVDGHNRLELWKKRNGFDESFEFLTTELPFADREDAREWIIKNQLGRRNLSPEDFKILLGMLYSSRKKQGKRTDLTSGKNCQRLTAAQQIAEEFHVSERTVRNAEADNKKAEELRKEEPQLSLPEAVRKVRGKKKSTPKPPTPKPELTPKQKQEALEKLLEKRWGKFIKDIPVTDHSAVREWLNQKLKQSAL
jgi:hypothetical protein